MKESGIGFCGLLTIAFIVLKLCNIIHWSWIWVLSPMWIPITLFLTFVTFLLFIYILLIFITINK